MAKHGLKPIRRVVTGNDERGRSKVIWDGAAPSVHEMLKGNYIGHTDLWVWRDSPAPLSGEDDAGNIPYDFPGPPNGGHMRVVESGGRPIDYDATKDPYIVVPHEPKEVPTGRRWDRGGKNLFTGDGHKTETIDYGLLVAGERVLILDDAEVTMKPGDVVIDVGAWHQWKATRPEHNLMAFDMFSARFVDGPVGLAQGRDPVMRAERGKRLPEGVKPARRIVIVDRQPGKSTLLSDGPSPDVRLDSARPGFASARLWVTDSSPAKIVMETLHLPHTIEPPPRGSVCRTITIPPDDNWKGRVGSAEVKAFFAAMGSPGASTYSPKAPHPYMQRTNSLDFCCVTEGAVVLILDSGEVHLERGDFVVQRGTSHAWGNRTNQPAVVWVASHDGSPPKDAR